MISLFEYSTIFERQVVNIIIVIEYYHCHGIFLDNVLSFKIERMYYRKIGKHFHIPNSGTNKLLPLKHIWFKKQYEYNHVENVSEENNVFKKFQVIFIVQ
jgi:hypothetical protein